MKVKTIKTNKITTIMLKITIPKLSIYVQTTSNVIVIWYIPSKIHLPVYTNRIKINYLNYLKVSHDHHVLFSY